MRENFINITVAEIQGLNVQKLKPFSASGVESLNSTVSFCLPKRQPKEGGLEGYERGRDQFVFVSV